MNQSNLVVRAPASSANLGAGFDVFGMAVDLHADVGVGHAPSDAQQVDEHHPAREAFDLLGGTGPVWLRCNIPMARGLGFSGAVRVAAASLAVCQRADDPMTAIAEGGHDILELTTRLEGHGDNVAASLFGGVTAFVEPQARKFSMGPFLGGAAFVAWIPDVTTSTDKSRKTLAPMVDRSTAVFNIGRSVQFVLAFAHDDPELLIGATDDRLHQASRLPLVPGAADVIAAGVEAGAWCAWLSGSGPTVGMLAAPEIANAVAASLPTGGHTKVLGIDTTGARLVATATL